MFLFVYWIISQVHSVEQSPEVYCYIYRLGAIFGKISHFTLKRQSNSFKDEHLLHFYYLIEWSIDIV